ncbi:hypothetical protein [Tateyamaria sp. SN3-11]|uniref:hypothetical protein n=1 Tax=Tateyamaria sp. SN3-11 TaxID=3092147 RepID=UPI0039ED6C4D
MTAFWAFITYPFLRQRRPLAARRPGRVEMGQTRAVPLGMEATDLDLVNQVSRKNDALERSHVIATKRTKLGDSFASASSTQIAPMPEDETYAARYHSAYIKKDT